MPTRTPTHTAADLRAVAKYQKWASVCVIVQTLSLVLTAAVIGQVVDGPPARVRAVGMFLLVGLAVLNGGASGVVAGLLVGRLSNAFLGLVAAGLAVWPFVGLVVPLAAGVWANRVFRRHGVRVGPLGPDARDIDALEDAAPVYEGAGEWVEEDEGW